MNALPASATPAWSRHRWTGTVLALLAAQISLIFWLSDRTPAPRYARANPPAADLLLEVPPTSGFAQELGALDPTLFALPHPQNFSGAAWSSLKALPQPPNYWVDNSDLRPLPLALQTAGASWPQQLATIAFPSVADKPVRRWLETLVTEEPLRTGSVAYIEGALSARPVVYMPAWPIWPWREPASNSTLVQIWVDPQGLVQQAGLWDESGMPEADQQAVRLARQIRFKAIADSENQSLAWGQLVVRWGTTPLPAAAKTPSAP